MDKTQIFLTLAGLIVVPSAIAGARYIRKTADRLTKIEAFEDFIKKYLLKDAVLTFHSNPNPQTDQIIEKIGAGEQVSVNEIKQLEQKLQDVAEHADDAKKRLKAEATLELMKWVFEELEPTQARSRARNDLFTE